MPHSLRRRQPPASTRLEPLEPRLLLAGQIFYVNNNWHKSSGAGTPVNGDLVDNAGSGDDASLRDLIFGTNAFADLAAALPAATAGGGGNTVVFVSGTYGASSSATLITAITLEGWPAFAATFASPAPNPDPDHLTQSLLDPSLPTSLIGAQFTFADPATSTSFVTGLHFTGYPTSGAIILATSNHAAVTLSASAFTNAANATAILITGGIATISANHITLGDNSTGIVVAASQSATITANIIDRATFLGFAGILVSDNGPLYGGIASPAAALISGNRISGAQFGIGLDGSGSDPVTATITANTFSTLATAIYLQDAATVDISHNQISSAGLGIDNSGATALITANSISGTTTAILLENAASGTLTATRFDAGTPNTVDLEIGDVASFAFGGGNHFAASDAYISNESPVEFNLTREFFPTRDPAVLADKTIDQTDVPEFGLLTINLDLSLDSLQLSSSTIHAADILTLTGTYTDQASADPHQLHVDWGDGSPVQTFDVTANAFSIPHLFVTAGTASITAYLTASDGALTSTITRPLTILPGQVLTRDLFYKNSAFDIGSHDNAIAPDKTPLLPGQTASSANYSSYTLGINGLIIDLAGSVTGLDLSDFQFTVGNDDTPANWPAAVTPALTLRPAQGINASTRVEITFPDNAIIGQWLQITIKATPHTGLVADDVFYFGNAPAEAGNSPDDAKVNAADQLAPRFAPTLNADLSNPYDYNRDGQVNPSDELAARQNYTYFLNELHLIHPPSLLGPQASLAPAAATVTSPRILPLSSASAQFQPILWLPPKPRFNKLNFTAKLTRRHS